AELDYAAFIFMGHLRVDPRQLERLLLLVRKRRNLLKYDSYDAHLAIAREWSRPCCVNQLVSFLLDVSNDCCSGPNFIPRYIDMMLNFRTVECVGPSVGQHRAKEVSSLLIRHREYALWLSSPVEGYERQEATVPTIYDRAIRVRAAISIGDLTCI